MRRFLSRCWGGAAVTTPALAVLARLEDDPLPVLEPVGGQLAVDADDVSRWAELVRVDRPYLVEQAGRAARGDWVGAVREAGRDAPLGRREEAGGVAPSPAPAPQHPERLPVVTPMAGAESDPASVGDLSGSRWLKGWRAIRRFVNRYEPFEEEALRKWSRHPIYPLPVKWTGGKVVGGKRLGARVHAERADVLGWLKRRQRLAVRSAA